jgi:hypothetical protein
MPFHGGIKRYVKKAVAKATGKKASKPSGKKAWVTRHTGPASGRAKPSVPTAKAKKVREGSKGWAAGNFPTNR